MLNGVKQTVLNMQRKQYLRSGLMRNVGLRTRKETNSIFIDHTNELALLRELDFVSKIQNIVLNMLITLYLIQPVYHYM